MNTSRLIGSIKEHPPAAIVVDLDRLPSSGRAVGVAFRASPATRHIPLIFAGGLQEKVAVVRQELPDAAYTAWKNAAAAVRKALKAGPKTALRPVPLMERYADAGLVRKLGLKSGVGCALLRAPEGFEDSLDGLPEDFSFQNKMDAASRLVIWFARTAAEMVLAVERASLHLPPGASLWIIYPKRAGRLASDFVAADVREAGLAVGLVDYKICSVDCDWTGMKFARRKK